jgi:hypothetical protein
LSKKQLAAWKGFAGQTASGVKPVSVVAVLHGVQSHSTMSKTLYEVQRPAQQQQQQQLMTNRQLQHLK